MSYQPDKTLFLRSIEQVRDEWHRRSGERLSRSMVWTILRDAQKKLRQAIERNDGSGESGGNEWSQPNGEEETQPEAAT